MAQKICLGVELSSSGLKVALVEPDRKNIVKVDAIPTSGDSIEDASIYTSTISSWVHSNSSMGIDSVGIALPVYNGIIRLINLPRDLPKENRFGYVEWEYNAAINSKSNDYLPEVFYYPNDKKPERAIVRAWNKKIVDSLNSAVVKKSGFGPTEKEMDIFALQNLLEYSEGWDNQPKCILKVDEKFAIASWVNETGPLTLRILPKDCISSEAVLDILQSGYAEFPKVKRNVKLCGELSTNTEFAAELASAAINLKDSIEVQPWNALPKFSFNKNSDFSKLSQCLGAIGVTFSL
jgi:hypothetical protein